MHAFELSYVMKPWETPASFDFFKTWLVKLPHFYLTLVMAFVAASSGHDYFFYDLLKQYIFFVPVCVVCPLSGSIQDWKYTSSQQTKNITYLD